MDDALASLFANVDDGTISRRQLLRALGLAAVAVPLSRALPQGSCGPGSPRAGSAACDTTPAKSPFEPTGWKTVSMDHFTMQCVDYKREAAYYAALMNWKVRSDDGSRVVLDIGDDVGTVVIRGGYQPPPPPAPPLAAGDAAAGRGLGRGNRPPRHAVWDSFCFGIDDWDRRKVEAALRKRGLDPEFTEEGRDVQAFTVKDPGGFTLRITDGSRRDRRGSGRGALPAPAPFEPTNWKTVWLDHISFQCPNYKESTAFYAALLGWTPTGDEGSQNECMIGDVGNIIIRGGNPAAGGGRAGGGGRGAGDSIGGRGGQAAPPSRRVALIDHVSFGIEPWDADSVKAELDKRGLSARPDTGSRLDIHDPAAKYKSYHTTTPNRFDLQISNATKATRRVR
jgi:catechol 2,3-dioxygenase-like lactoylglutathione lyase family enzyme